MALHFDAHITASEESDQTIQKAAHAVVPAVEQRRAAERYQPAGPAFELFEGQQRLCPLGRASSCASRGGRDFDSLPATQRERGDATQGSGMR